MNSSYNMTTKSILGPPATSCFLVFDERMALHRPLPSLGEVFPHNESDQMHHTDAPFENSSRIIRLYNEMMQLEHRLMISSQARNHQANEDPVPRRFIPLQPEPCSRSTILLAHSEEHYDQMAQTEHLSDEQLEKLCRLDADLYYCRDTFLAASLAAGGVVEAVRAVLTSSTVSRAIALVRPPGHHATRDRAMGFCYFNNVAVAAKYAIHSKLADRVMILDWDIHHGNGTQDITYEDENIFFISLHRANFGTNRSSRAKWFYPGTGRPTEVGAAAGAGTNLNVVWTAGGMGNTEYAAAFSELILPVLAAADPDLIICSCGFDAAQGDSLGDCKLTPDMYYAMTNSLLEKAGRDTPIVMALEGGYDLDTIATCMEATALALLDEPYNETMPKETVCRNHMALCHAPPRYRESRYNPFSLSRYWRHEDLMWKKKDKKTARAISAIQLSARALLNKQREVYLNGIQYYSNTNPLSRRARKLGKATLRKIMPIARKS